MRRRVVKFRGAQLFFLSGIMLQTQGFMDVEIAHWNWSKTLFDDAPKHWMGYIHKFLEGTLSNCNKKIHSQCCLQSLEIQSNVFMYVTWYKKIRSKHTIGCDCKTYDDIAEMLGPCWRVAIKDKHYASKYGYNPNFCILQNTTTLHPPTGRITHDANEQGKDEQFEGPACWDCLLIEPERFTIAMTWHIEAKSMFASKLIFQQIDIYKMYSSCSMGNVSVLNNVNYKHGSQDHLYCGKHAPFNVYSSAHNCSLLLTYYHLIGLEIKVAFTVITSNVIKSQSVLLQSTHVKVSSVYYLPRLEAKLWSYHIQTEKHQQIHLELLETVEMHIRLFDGPGTLSREKKWYAEMSNKIHLSTFQCLLQIFQLLEKKHFSSQTQMMYRTGFSLKTPQIFTVSHSEIELEIPRISDKRLLFRQDVFAASTGALKHINISITKIVFSGTETTSCTFGGISFLEQNNNNGFSELQSICKNTSATTCKSNHMDTTHRTFHSCPRNIYTSGRSMYIVVYSYKDYSGICVSLKIVETQCKPIKIDICKFNELCPERHEQHL